MNAYQTGKLGLADGIGLVMVMIIPRMFLTSLASSIDDLQQIAWLTIIINTIIVLLAVFMMAYVKEGMPGDIFTVCKQLVGAPVSWLIMVSYIVMFWGNSILLLRQYAEYTLLTALPDAEFQLVIFWYVITVGIICYMGIEALTRAGYILLPFLVASIIILLIMLSPFYIAYHLTPWQGNGIMKAIELGVKGASFNFGALALVLMPLSFQNVKTMRNAGIYALGGSMVLKIMYMLIFVMVFGTSVGSEKSMPLFELARLVYLNQYIQRIESLYIVVWVIFGMLAIACSLYVGLYLMALLLKLPTLRPIVPLGVLLIANFAMLPPNIETAVSLDQLLIKVLNIGVYVFPTLLFILAFFKKRGKKSCTSA